MVQTTTTAVKTGMPRDRSVLYHAEYLKLCFEHDADQIFVEYGAPGGVCAHIQGDIWRVHTEGDQPPTGNLLISLRSKDEKSAWKQFAELVEHEDEIWIAVDGDVTRKKGWSISIISAVGETTHSSVKLACSQSFPPPDGGIPKVCSTEENPIPVIKFKDQ